MEGQVWCMIEKLLSFVEGSPARCRYRDRDILRVVLWATLKDRPIVWACQPQNWPEDLRPACLPDPSTVSRRWHHPELQQVAYALHDRSIDHLGAVSRYAALDGRPLLVGGCSKDPDARIGRAAGGLGKGYKMHAVVDRRNVILAYLVRPMNEAEPTVARTLLPKIPAAVTRVVADGVYDSVRLHRVAQATGRKLYTPLRQNRVGRRQQPRRLQLLRLGQSAAGQRLMRSWDQIERTFGLMSTISFGFKGLPAWARRNHRVFRWMWAKNLLHHAWLLTNPNAA